MMQPNHFRLSQQSYAEVLAEFPTLTLLLLPPHTLVEVAQQQWQDLPAGMSGFPRMQINKQAHVWN